MINFYPFTNLNAIRVKDIVHALKNGATAASICDAPAENVRYSPPGDKSIFFKKFVDGKALTNAATLGADGVIESLKKTELAGRGGAYFPTWKKWKAAKEQTATPKFVVCNADEGEPGTFKDRVLINTQAKSMIEGMMVCGYTIGAEYGIIYLRGEYRWLKPKLDEAIDDYRKKGEDVDGLAADVSVSIGGS